MATHVGAPRPRVLLYGLSDEEVEVVRSLAGSVIVTDNLTSVHPEEHDALILAQSQFHDYTEGFPRRLVFGPRPRPKATAHDVAVSSGFGNPYHRTFTDMITQHKPARDFAIGDDARRLHLEGLVRRSFLPESGEAYTGFRVPVYPEREALVLAWEVLEHPLALAAILENRTQAGLPIDSAVWLPDLARSAFREWVQFAFSHWREDAPEVFPVSAEWKRAEQWASLDELSARERLLTFDAAEAARRESADAERRQHAAELERVESRGESWRALITATDDELVAAVKDALELFGFTVQDADELPQHKAAKREDLRVTDGDWTALVEVKGYTGAAKSNDLQQVTRAATVFAAREGRVPDALWYVPNVERETDPAQRSMPLAGREDDLLAFGENHSGCLIDTRDLYALRQAVVTGITEPAAAREELKTARGRFVAEASAPSPR